MARCVVNTTYSRAAGESAGGSIRGRTAPTSVSSRTRGRFVDYRRPTATHAESDCNCAARSARSNDFLCSALRTMRHRDLALVQIPAAPQLVRAANNARRDVLADRRIKMRTPRCGNVGRHRRLVVAASVPSTFKLDPVDAVERAYRHCVPVARRANDQVKALTANPGGCSVRHHATRLAGALP